MVVHPHCWFGIYCIFTKKCYICPALFFAWKNYYRSKGYLISSEVSFQLSNLKNTRNLYMNYYLIFSIAYGHVFEDLLREKHVDFRLEPVYAWYLVLYKHKVQYNFYLVHNNFILEFKKLILVLVHQDYLLKKPLFSLTKDLMKLMHNLLLSGCLVVKRSLLFSGFMYRI